MCIRRQGNICNHDSVVPYAINLILLAKKELISHAHVHLG